MVSVLGRGRLQRMLLVLKPSTCVWQLEVQYPKRREGPRHDRQRVQAYKEINREKNDTLITCVQKRENNERIDNIG